jgi:hypothetical protein
MNRSPLYDAINYYGEPENRPKKIKVTEILKRKDQQNLFAHLTFIEDPTLEEFTTLSSLKGGAAFISNVLGLSLGTVQQMKYVGYTTRYWHRYLEARRVARAGNNVSG